jgi:hypothetical protein
VHEKVVVVPSSDEQSPSKVQEAFKEKSAITEDDHATIELRYLKLVIKDTLRLLLVFVNANREIRKRTDTIVVFTQEYSRVSYLSSGKQWLKK